MAHEKLKNMACYREMHDRLVAGVPIPDIARWLQEEKGEYQGAKLDSVVRALFRYKDDIPARELGLADGAVTQRRLEEIEGDLNEVEALTKLARLQLGRVAFARDLEEKLGFPNSNVYKDVAEARNTLVALADLKFKLGIYKKTPETVNLNHNVSTAAAIDQLDAEQRKRAAALADRLLGEVLHLTAGDPPAALPDDEPDYVIVETQDGA
jgi:hypothetical protein